jgi:hypothetical protein
VSTDHGLRPDLPNTLAQYGSEDAANTNSEHAPSQPGTAKEQGHGLLSEKAAGKKRAEAQPDGESSRFDGQVGEGRLCEAEDAGGEQGFYDMCVDDGQSTETPVRHFGASFNPVRHFIILSS